MKKNETKVKKRRMRKKAEIDKERNKEEKMNAEDNYKNKEE